MSIYEYDEEKHMRQVREEGKEEGIKEGQEIGVRAFIELCRDLGLSDTVTGEKLRERLALSTEAAEEYLKKYW